MNLCILYSLCLRYLSFFCSVLFNSHSKFISNSPPKSFSLYSSVPIILSTNKRGHNNLVGGWNRTSIGKVFSISMGLRAQPKSAHASSGWGCWAYPGVPTRRGTCMHKKCSSLTESFGYQVSKNKSFNFIIINCCVNWEKIKFITYVPMMVVGQTLSVFGNSKGI